MENIRKMKEAQQMELGKLFDKLNQVEDEYLVSERVLANLQTAIKQNTEEVKHVQSQMQFIEEEKRKLEVEASRLEEQLQEAKNLQSEQAGQQAAIAKKIHDHKAQIDAKLKEAESVQARLVTEQMAAFEAKCKLELIEAKSTQFAAELQNLVKTKAKREGELAAKVQALRDHLKNKSKSEDEIERIKALLATIDGTDFTKACLCDLKGDVKNAMFEVVYKADQLLHSKQPYPFYEQMVADHLAEKDVT
jgi:chromosome segregation ATPase